MLALASLNLASLQSWGDASPTPDQTALAWLRELLSFRCVVAVVLVWLLWIALKEWREWHDLSAFAPAGAWLVFVYGLKEWSAHMEGEMLAWPLKVAGLLALIVIPRLMILERRRAKHLEQLKTMPEPQNPSGASKESDFKDWA